MTAKQTPRLSDTPIFISHSSEDKTAARIIAGYLRTHWTVWIDEAGIVGGKDWRGELIRALETAWVVILLVSLNSMRSKWVMREIDAADRLGKTIIPVVVEEAPYPDSLRMILAGVQILPLDGLGDDERRGPQLARLDEALVHAAQSTGRSTPGKALILAGRIIRAIGIVGFLFGFALFAYLGITEVSRVPSGDFSSFFDSSFGGIPRPFIGWGIALVFLIIAGIGEGMRRAGMRKGI
jgi:hypothetical protein